MTFRRSMTAGSSRRIAVRQIMTNGRSSASRCTSQRKWLPANSTSACSRGFRLNGHRFTIAPRSRSTLCTDVGAINEVHVRRVAAMLHSINEVRSTMTTRRCSLRDELRQIAFAVFPVLVVPAAYRDLLAMIGIAENESTDAIQVNLVDCAITCEDSF